MIATITLNPAVDKSVTVRGFAAGKTNRCDVDRVDAGGKGINVAKVLRRLRLPVCALGFVAGSNGRFIMDDLSREGISADFIEVAGETRVNLKIHDSTSGTETELNEPGFRVSVDDLDRLRRNMEAYAPKCDVMVFSGSLPPDVPPSIFADLICMAKAHGVKCFLDTAGPALKLGLAAAPFLVKPNRVELEEVEARALPTLSEWVKAGRRLLGLGCRQVLISLGAQGAVGIAGDEAIFARPPAVKVRSSVGAGDTMVAVMAYAAVNAMPFRQAFRMAVAASAATVAMEGTRVADLPAVEALIPAVTLEAAER